MTVPPHMTVRTIIAVLVIGILVLSSFLVVRPFLPATIWAVTVVVATWPLLLRLQALLWHSRALAVAVTTLATLLVFIVPFWLAVATIVGRADQLMSFARSVADLRFPAPPRWLDDLPLVGAALAASWAQLKDTGLSLEVARVAPYAGRLTRWLFGAVGSVGLLVVQFLLTVAITAILHAKGEAAAQFVFDFGYRLAGSRGRDLVVLAGQAVRAVAIGVMLTAVVESAIGGVGLLIVGVPLYGLLTAVMFLFCLAQFGPGVVLIPAVIWMYVFRNAGPATLLAAISVVAITVDNLLRPFLIRKEADLPMLLVLTGVIGGLGAFGLVGVFVGPTVLAVSYNLLSAWLVGDEAAPYH